VANWVYWYDGSEPTLMWFFMVILNSIAPIEGSMTRTIGWMSFLVCLPGLTRVNDCLGEAFVRYRTERLEAGTYSYSR